MIVRPALAVCYVARPDATGGSHEFLQLRRAADDYLGGTWQPVRGFIEPGETAWAAALRELSEEAGLVPDAFYRLAVVNTFYIPSAEPEKDAIYHEAAFLALVGRSAPVTLNAEHDALRWVARADVNDRFMWETDRRALASAGADVLDRGMAEPHLRIELPPR